MSEVNFDYYKVFYYVAKFKNITAAASALYLSQPSVSRCIANLEGALDCKLFTRSKKGVELTPEGKLLFKHITIACKHIFSAEEEISIYNKSKGGIIRLGISEAALHGSALSRLVEFHRSFPLVKLKIDNMTTPEAIDALRSNLIDAAIVTSPFVDKDDLNITVLDKLQDILIGGPEFADLKDKTISLSDIPRYPLVAMQSSSSTRHYLDNIFRLHNILIRPDIELASIHLVLPLVKNNLGIGFVTNTVAAEAIARGEVFEIKIKETLPERSICAVTCDKYPAGSIIKDFMTTLKNE